MGDSYRRKSPGPEFPGRLYLRIEGVRGPKLRIKVVYNRLFG